MARQYLRFTPETTWGTYNNLGTATIVRLDQDNAFTMRPAPVRWSINSADAYARRVQTGSSKTTVQGTLNTLCYGSQMAAFVAWWYASSANVLSSATIDHALVMEDSGGTAVYRRYLGCMASQVQITASDQDQLMRQSIQIIAQKPATITGTDFPEPAVTAYPTDAPYVIEHGSGAFSLATSRSEFETFSWTCKNKLDPRFMASQYLTRLKYCGRDVDFSTRFPYVITTDRSDYEAVTALSASITFTNGSHTLAFAMNSKNFIAKCDDDLALDKVHLQGIDAECYFDSSAGTPNDCAITVT